MKSRLPKEYSGGANNMAKKFQLIQKQIQEKSEEIEQMSFTSSSGGGAVTAVVSGKKIIESLAINPEVVDPEDVEMLQDLIIGAVNEALRQVEETTETEIDRITAGLPIPGI